MGRLIRKSMATLAPEFSSNRMLRDYVENYYASAIKQYRQRIENKVQIAKELVAWQQQITLHWSAIYMQNFKIELSEEGFYATLHVYLDELPVDFVKVEIFANAEDNDDFFLKPMTRKASLSGAVNGYIYEAIVPTNRPFDHYTPRIVPISEYANIPSEENHIKWYH